MKIHPPLYLIRSMEPCWKCARPQPVIALGAGRVTDEDGDLFAPDDGDMILLSNIPALPDPIFAVMHAANPRYQSFNSYTAGSSYLANVCECGANFGDDYLFSEPGGAFFPLTDADVAKISYERLPWTEAFEIDCQPSGGPGANILKNGRTYQG